MNKTKFITSFAVLSLAAGALVGMASISSLDLQANASLDPHHVEWSSRPNLDSEANKDYFTTNEGYKIFMGKNDKVSYVDDGIYQLSGGATLFNETYIGSITKFTLEYTLDGKVFTDENPTTPLRLSYGYRGVRETLDGQAVMMQADTFKTTFDFGGTTNILTPSRIQIDSLMNNVVIKKITIDFGCTSHVDSDLTQPEGMYTVGSFATNKGYEWSCFGGKRMSRNDNDKQYELIGAKFNKGDQFTFKKTNSWLNNPKLKLDWSNADDHGLVKQSYDGANIEVLADCVLNIYAKDDSNIIVNYNSLTSLDWYVTGKGTFMAGLNEWGINESLKLHQQEGEGNEMILESDPITFGEGDQFKIRDLGYWTGNLNPVSNEFATVTGGNICINAGKGGKYVVAIDFGNNWAIELIPQA